MTQDPDGRKYQVVGDKYNWRCGMAVRATGAAVARASPTPVRGGPGQTQGPERLCGPAEADHRSQKPHAPASARVRKRCGANADVLTALELQNSDAGNAAAVWRIFFDFAKAVPVLHGRPSVRQCEAVLPPKTLSSPAASATGGAPRYGRAILQFHSAPHFHIPQGDPMAIIDRNAVFLKLPHRQRHGQHRGPDRLASCRAAWSPCPCASPLPKPFCPPKSRI